MDNASYVVKLTSLGQLSIKGTDDKVPEIVMPYDRIVNAGEEAILSIISKSFSDVDGVEQLSNAVQRVIAEYDGYARTAVERGGAASIPVSWTIEVFADPEAPQLSAVVLDIDESASCVKEWAEQHNPTHLHALNSGIESDINQRIGSTFTSSVAAVELDASDPICADSSAGTNRLNFAIVNGDDRHNGHSAKYAITLDHMYCIRRLGGNIAVDEDGHSPREELVTFSRTDGTLMAQRVFRNTGTLFDVVDVTAVVGSLSGLSENVQTAMSNLAAHAEGKHLNKKLKKALQLAANTVNRNVPLIDRVKSITDNHLLYDPNVPVNSLYFMGGSKGPESCKNSVENVVKLTRGMEALEAFFAMVGLSNVDAMLTAKTKLIKSGDDYDWLNSTHNAERNGVGDHALRYAAMVNERVTLPMISTVYKMVMNCNYLEDAIRTAELWCTEDKYVSSVLADVKCNTRAIKELCLQLQSTTVRDVTSVGDNQEVMLGNTVQMYVPLNPNEFIDYDYDAARAVDAARGTHAVGSPFRFYNDLYYEIAGYDATGDISYAQCERYGLHIPSIVMLQELLSDANEWPRFFQNNNKDYDNPGAVAWFTSNGFDLSFDPNSFQYGAYLISAARQLHYRDAEVNRTHWAGFKMLAAGLAKSGFGDPALFGGFMTAIEAMNMVRETVKNSIIGPSRHTAPQFKFNAEVVNRNRDEQWPIAVMTKVDLTRYGTLKSGKKLTDSSAMIILSPSRVDRNIEHFTGFEPIEQTDRQHFHNVTSKRALWDLLLNRAARFYFAPGVNCNDVFAEGVNITFDEDNGFQYTRANGVTPQQRTILCVGERATPVLFRRRLPEDMFFTKRKDNVATAASLNYDNDILKHALHDDGFQYGCLGDAFVLIQERIVDFKARGAKYSDRYHSTVADNIYYFAPVICGAVKDTKWLSLLSNPLQAKVDSTTNVKKEDIFVNPSVVFKNAKADGELVIDFGRKDEIELGQDAVVNAIEEGDDGFTITFSMIPSGEDDADDVAYEFPRLCATTEYAGEDFVAAQKSLHGYRRLVCINTTRVPGGANGAPIALTHDTTVTGWEAGANYSYFVKRVDVLRPHSYAIDGGVDNNTFRGIRQIFSSGSRTAVNGDTAYGNPLFETDLTMENSREFSYRLEFRSYVTHAAAGAGADYMQLTLAELSTLINYPLDVLGVYDFRDSRAELASYACAYDGYEGDQHVVRHNGSVVTPEDDKYFDHLLGRYARDKYYPFTVPTLLIHVGTDTYVNNLMWLGTPDYYLNRRLTERNNRGGVYSVHMPTLYGVLQHDMRSNGVITPRILEIAGVSLGGSATSNSDEEDTTDDA